MSLTQMITSGQRSGIDKLSIILMIFDNWLLGCHTGADFVPDAVKHKLILVEVVFSFLEAVSAGPYTRNFIAFLNTTLFPATIQYTPRLIDLFTP